MPSPSHLKPIAHKRARTTKEEEDPKENESD